jgi:hypothetical protein
MQMSGQVGPQVLSDGVGTQPFRQIKTGELAVTEVHGRYYEQSRRGNLFYARALVTAPGGIASSSGIGGPLLWNGTTTVNANILAVSFTHTVVSTVATPLGFFLGAQATAPTGTTAIDSSGNCLVGGSASACNAYRIGTVSVVPPQFFPIVDVHTGSLTTDSRLGGWIDIGGMFTIPTKTYLCIGGTATASTLALQCGLIWEEVPV